MAYELEELLVAELLGYLQKQREIVTWYYAVFEKVGLAEDGLCFRFFALFVELLLQVHDLGIF